MTSIPDPGRATPRVAVDWVYVRTRTLIALVLVVLAAGGGGAWWWFGRDGLPLAQRAARAVAVAEEAVGQAREKVSGGELLTRAQRHLDLARRALVDEVYGEALTEAGTARDLAVQILGPAEEGGQPGVRITRVDGDVRIKRAGQFMWESASERALLAMGDQIRTGTRGRARLVFFDGTLLTVQPGTLLEIRELFRDESQGVQRVSERLAWGRVHGSTHESEGVDSVHEVSTASAALEARTESEFRVAHDREKGTSEFVALDGEVSLRAGDQQVPLAPLTRVSIQQGRIVDSKKILEPPLPKNPPDARTFLAPQSRRIQLDWFAVDGAESYRVQLSRHPAFGTILQEKQVVEARCDLPALPEGTFYWRIAAVDGDGDPGRWSDTRKFRVLGEKFQDPDDTQPPPLEVSEILVVGSNAIISGRSEPGALVWISGERVDVDDDGRFTWVIKLHHDGENRIRFQAQDAAGNETNRVGYAYVDVY
ncbi:MAG: FecR domain-containing protein [Acidobacteriota bacterium]|nr:FecR domain-containing protein [Acidobacteriota bacterium]MDQ7088103.1 FecR domain-containing protein [Acidobacteriota bacterium]